MSPISRSPTEPDDRNLPPSIRRPDSANAEGDTRRIGIELEFAGLRPEAIVEAVTASIGGHARRESAVAWALLDTTAGDLHLELDFRLLQTVAAEGAEARGATLPDGSSITPPAGPPSWPSGWRPWWCPGRSSPRPCPWTGCTDSSR
ncbi:MAG: amidoligase family protein [Gammaproteobacteria bacterium]|nr:amidoligase family protein [Gammaproteobacteria bacterium]